MEEGSVNCIECNNPMLLRTALKHDGKCVPCARGYRESIESGQRYYAEQKKLRDHPADAHWRSLCTKVGDPTIGFETLTKAEKIYFAVSLLEGEVFNGGFEQYFTNSSADYFSTALDGFEALNDSVSLSLVNRAKERLFGDEEVETDHARRNIQCKRLGHFDDSFDYGDLDEIDREFVSHYEEALRQKLLQFAFDHKFWGDEKTLYVI